METSGTTPQAVTQIPLPYAEPSTPPSRQWSPVPMMLASGLYGVLVTCLAFVDVSRKFRQIFMDFKVELPVSTKVVLWISQFIWDDHAWVILLPLSILWPLLAARVVPVPQRRETRRTIVLVLSCIVPIVYLVTAVVMLVALLAPMLALTQAVNAPRKN